MVSLAINDHVTFDYHGDIVGQLPRQQSTRRSCERFRKNLSDGSLKRYRHTYIS